MKNKIIELIETLKFNGMAMALDSQITLAENGTAAPEIICNLLHEELRFRQERSMQNRLKNAKMPWEWTLNSFPFKKQPDVNKNQIMTLAGLDFLQRGENIIFHGKTGVGKSGLAVGILRQALISGFRGRFYDVQRLLDDLYASLADRSTTKLLNALCRYDILVSFHSLKKIRVCLILLSHKINKLCKDSDFCFSKREMSLILITL